MKSRARPILNLQEIAQITGANLSPSGNLSMEIHGLASLEDAETLDISFFEGRRYLSHLMKSKAGACFVNQSEPPESSPDGMEILLAENPRLCFFKLSHIFYPEKTVQPGCHPKAHVDESAELSDSCQVDAGAFIGPRVKVGEGCWIGPNVVIDEGVSIDEKTWIGANSSLSHCQIGKNCVLYPGVRIGQSGFGFDVVEGKLLKIPHFKKVIIEDGVEVGANTAIDRGFVRDTVIGKYTVIDNLVHIAHNVRIGPECMISGQVGIAGSVKLGSRVRMGGQSGVAEHLNLGDGAQVMAGSGVTRDVPPGEVVGSNPAIPRGDFHRQTLILKSLTQQSRNRQPRKK